MKRIEFAQKSLAPRKPRPLLWLTLAVPALFSCGQNAAVSANPDPYAGGVTHPWAYTAPEGQLSAQSLTADVNTLSFEKLLSAKNGWGPIERDRSNGEQGANDGKTLTINGNTYTRGFGVHAGSEMVFSLKGTNTAKCSRFTADIGLDDEVGDRGSVVFQVYLDGVKAYDSGFIDHSSSGLNSAPPQSISLDIAGASELKLVVTDAGDGISYDHADWVNPQVDCRTNASGSRDLSFGANGKGIVISGGVDAVLEPSGAVLIAGSENGNFLIKRLLPGGNITQVVTDVGGGGTARALLRQPDGKIVVAGDSDATTSRLVRYNSDLTLDSGFGVGGVVLTRLPEAEGGSSYALTQQVDGKLVLAGNATVRKDDPENPDNTYLTSDVALVRYSASGVLDPSFGTAGVVIQGFDGPGRSAATTDEARAVLVQPDGKIVIAGRSDSQGAENWLLTRFNAKGSLDTDFGTNGLVNGAYYGTFSDVALEPSGNLVAVGYEGRYSIYGAVRRYSPSGVVDRAS